MRNKAVVLLAASLLVIGLLLGRYTCSNSHVAGPSPRATRPKPAEASRVAADPLPAAAEKKDEDINDSIKQEEDAAMARIKRQRRAGRPPPPPRQEHASRKDHEDESEEMDSAARKKAALEAKKKADRLKQSKSCGDAEPEFFVPDPMKEQSVEPIIPTSEFKPTGKILCWVLTCPGKHDRALAVNKSWGSRFDKLEFMSTATEAGLNVVVLPLHNESRNDLFKKTKMAWMYTHNHHLNHYDWFVKADDDSYLVVKNLRDYLATLNPNEPHYLGKRFVIYKGKETEQDYNSGGASYVLSREALRIMGEKRDMFKKTGHSEDLHLGTSLGWMGIHPGDTRDSEGRERFLPLRIDHLRYKHTRERKPDHWFWRYSYYEAKEGLECCSKHWISTHYTASYEFKTFDALVESGREASGRDPPKSEWRVIT